MTHLVRRASAGSTSTGLISEAAAAATIAPDAANTHPAVRRSPRNASHTARAAACSSVPSNAPAANDRPTASPTTSTIPVTATPIPSSQTARRRSRARAMAPAAEMRARTRKTANASRTSLAIRTASPVTEPRRSSTRFTFSSARTCLARLGRSAWSAPAITLPTSEIVSATVSWSR